MYQVLIWAGVFVLIGILFVWFAAGRISRPIIAMAGRVNRIAEGDLTVEKLVVKNKDEVGRLAQDLNAMVENLRNLIQRVGVSSDQAAATPEELTASALQTSKATEQIASTIQGVAVGLYGRNFLFSSRLVNWRKNCKAWYKNSRCSILLFLSNKAGIVHRRLRMGWCQPSPCRVAAFDPSFTAMEKHSKIVERAGLHERTVQYVHLNLLERMM